MGTVEGVACWIDASDNGEHTFSVSGIDVPHPGLRDRGAPRAGPGLVESAYCACLDRELTLQGVPFLREVPVTIEYKDLTVPNAYRADFVVAGSIVIEVKSVDSLISVHQAQLLTYLKLMNLDVGLLLNFNEVTLKKGIRRMARTRLPGTKFPGFS